MPVRGECLVAVWEATLRMQIGDFIKAVSGKKHAKIFHAAQLRDFETYVEMGRIAPRSELFERGTAEYTPFGSDADDVDRMGCANDCFGNLIDQGNFSRKGNGIPNVYGPITLVFKPEALRSPGLGEVSVRRKAIWSANPAGREVLDASGVAALYNDKGFADSGEIQIHAGALRLQDVQYIIVNPITVNGVSLAQRVRDLVQNIPGRENNPVRVYERKFAEDGLPVYEELVTWASDAPARDSTYDTLPEGLQERFAHLGAWKHDNIRRFADYLSHGTLSRLAGENGHLAAGVDLQYAYEEPEYDDEADLIQDITALDADELNARDEALWQVERAEFHLGQARLAPESATRKEQIESAWQEYVEALEDLNLWIEETYKRILAGRDDMHERLLGSHDSQISSNLTAWADEFEALEIPYDDEGAPEQALVDWRKVRDYSEAGW